MTLEIGHIFDSMRLLNQAKWISFKETICDGFYSSNAMTSMRNMNEADVKLAVYDGEMTFVRGEQIERSRQA